MDLDASFERIGYRGARAPTVEVLNQLVRAHVEAIPFENLDVLRLVPIELSSPGSSWLALAPMGNGSRCSIASSRTA